MKRSFLLFLLMLMGSLSLLLSNVSSAELTRAEKGLVEVTRNASQGSPVWNALEAIANKLESEGKDIAFRRQLAESQGVNLEQLFQQAVATGDPEIIVIASFVYGQAVECPCWPNNLGGKARLYALLDACGSQSLHEFLSPRSEPSSPYREKFQASCLAPSPEFTLLWWVQLDLLTNLFTNGSMPSREQISLETQIQCALVPAVQTPSLITDLQATSGATLQLPRKEYEQCLADLRAYQTYEVIGQF